MCHLRQTIWVRTFGFRIEIQGVLLWMSSAELCKARSSTEKGSKDYSSTLLTVQELGQVKNWRKSLCHPSEQRRSTTGARCTNDF